jgi:hypothetical protein
MKSNASFSLQDYHSWLHMNDTRVVLQSSTNDLVTSLSCKGNSSRHQTRLSKVYYQNTLLQSQIWQQSSKVTAKVIRNSGSIKNQSFHANPSAQKHKPIPSL